MMTIEIVVLLEIFEESRNYFTVFWCIQDFFFYLVANMHNRAVFGLCHCHNCCDDGSEGTNCVVQFLCPLATNQSL